LDSAFHNSKKSKAKGLSRIDPDREREIKLYYLFFICSDDKIKPEKPSSLYTPPDFRRPYEMP
jgi:hypothetical protein